MAKNLESADEPIFSGTIKLYSQKKLKELIMVIV